MLPAHYAWMRQGLIKPRGILVRDRGWVSRKANGVTASRPIRARRCHAPPRPAEATMSCSLAGRWTLGHCRARLPRCCCCLLLSARCRTLLHARGYRRARTWTAGLLLFFPPAAATTRRKCWRLAGFMASAKPRRVPVAACWLSLRSPCITVSIVGPPLRTLTLNI